MQDTHHTARRAIRADAPAAGRPRGAAAMPQIRSQAEHEAVQRRGPAPKVARSAVAPGRPRVDLALIGLLGLWVLLVLGIRG